jgi:hypothetical protein
VATGAHLGTRTPLSVVVLLLGLAANVVTGV